MGQKAHKRKVGKLDKYREKGLQKSGLIHSPNFKGKEVEVILGAL